jgi:nicotinamidase/pyrazinamidase
VSRALIVVDMQRDFISGSLAVPEAEEIVAGIVRRMRSPDYGLVVLTRDWHPQDTPHFEQWPVHCVAGTPGAEFDPRIRAVALERPGLPECVSVVSKGLDDTDGYSGFEGVTSDGLSLQELLDHAEAEAVDVVGLALDYCVKATALDAANLRYPTNVSVPLTRWVSLDTAQRALVELADAGVNLYA